MKARPFPVDVREYPFASCWFERNGQAMHYIDEGEGTTVVFCHGNPTWSYVYRNIIKMLAPRCRCVAYDLPGFGFSDHPPGYGYTPQEHVAWVEALLMEHLRLERFILVVQDWGGPIGLDIATRHPGKIAGLVISSTFAWPPTAIGKIFSRVMGSAVGQYLILQRNFFATTIVSQFMNKNVGAVTRQAYAAPFPTAASRKGTAVFPIQITAAASWLAQIEARLPLLIEKPVQFIFGLKDPGTRPADITRWLCVFPNAVVQRIPNANHFTQEDCPQCYVTAIEALLAVDGRSQEKRSTSARTQTAI